jgi:lysophospholipase L1-like esterase
MEVFAMRGRFSSAIVGLAALVLAAGLPRSASGGSMTYIALGDSVAFGETDFTHNPSYGDRGYVSLVANSLAATNGGVRPNVVNLGVDGETSSSFFGGGQALAPQNLNYPSAATSQNTLLVSQIASQQAAGNTIGAVTVSLGANDLFAAVGAPGFFAMNPAQQQSAILASMSTVQNNYTALLTELHALAPSAAVTLVGYYNPYPAVPGSPLAPLAGPAIQLLNAVIAGEAAAFGAKYVDTYTAFQGKESLLTHITDAPAGTNVHPNDAGYAVIGNLVQPVPEPATVALFGVFGLGLIGRAAYRRRRAA